MNVICPHCGKEVAVIRYGNAWVAACCDRIVYNNDQLPDNVADEQKVPQPAPDPGTDAK